MTNARVPACPRDNLLLELQKTIYASSNYTRRRLHQARLKWVESAIERYAPTAKVSRAIEYGPGCGIYLNYLSQVCDDVVGADVEHAYLSSIEPLTASLPNLRIVEDDIEESRLPAGHFGFVLCTEVLEHVRNPEQSLANLHRILVPGGLAVVTTPQRYSLMEACCKIAFLPGVIQLARFVYREPILPSGHISLRSKRAFQRAISTCGFNIVESTTFGLYVPVLAELGADAGGRLIERLERRIAGTPMAGLLWTQAYVLRK